MISYQHIFHKPGKTDIGIMVVDGSVVGGFVDVVVASVALTPGFPHPNSSTFNCIPPAHV